MNVETKITALVLVIMEINAKWQNDILILQALYLLFCTKLFHSKIEYVIFQLNEG